MSVDLFDNRFRLRRSHFPRVRPATAPYGFAGGVGWLAPGLLWVDGWLSLEPTAEIDVAFTLAGKPLRRSARCFVAPPFHAADGLAARRWVLVVDVGEGFETASRLHRFSLLTRSGELEWLGACDRLVQPDVVDQLRDPRVPADQLARLRSFVETTAGIAGIELDDPLLRRNLCALAEASDSDHPPPTAVGGVELASAVTIGSLPDAPDVSLIVTLLSPPDLLVHHFLHHHRSRGELSTETIFVVGPGNASLDFYDRVRELSDLYESPALILELAADAPWAAAARFAARRARGEILVFFQEQTFGFERSTLRALVQPLLDDQGVGITAPAVRYFDGSFRSRGFQLADDAVGSRRIEAVPRLSGEPPRVAIDACSSECFAIRRELFEELRGFSGSFVHPDGETIDLSLRARAVGFAVQGVDLVVSRLTDEAEPIDSPSGRAELDVLHRRFLATSSEAVTGGRPTANGRGPEAESPPVTVVIPTLNPGPELGEVLDRLESQSGVELVQILVIDSSSSDGTLELVRERGVEHLVIARRDFNHGLTRNVGVREARGEIVAFLSQDALPEPGWLAALVAAFRDPTVGGAYSRQVPRQGASPFSIDNLSRWPATDEAPRRQCLPSLRLFDRMSLQDRLDAVCFDNVSSAVRRSLALQLPFRDLPFGEDRDWAYRAMAAGHAIEYCSESRVVHSHELSAWLNLRRTAIDHRLIHEMLVRPDEGDDHPSSLLPAIRGELFRLLDISSQAPTRWRRLRCRAQAPARAVVGLVGAHLGRRIAEQSAAGSRKWCWLGRTLAS